MIITREITIKINEAYIWLVNGLKVYPNFDERVISIYKPKIHSNAQSCYNRIVLDLLITTNL